MGTRLSKGLYYRGAVVQVRTDPIDGKQRSTGCTDPEAANLWLADRERLAASPNYAASTKASIGDWVLKTLDHKKAQGKSDGTLHMYGVKLGHVARIFGTTTALAAVTPGAVDEFIAQRKNDGAVNNTIARELTCLRQMLRLARRAGAFGRGLDEVMPIGFSANYTPVTRTLKREDLETLINGLPEDKAAWVCAALATAGDVSDVERMLPEHWDPVRGVFRMLGTKNRLRSAEIPVPKLLRPLLERALPMMPLSWPRASKALPEATKRLGIGHLSPKDLRRSACTWLVEAGVPEDAVSRWMRHKNSRMVREIYGQMRPEALGKIIDERLQKRDSDRGPLGGIGRRGGFKRRGQGDGESRLAEIVGLAGRELARSAASGRTETLQGANRVRLERLLLLEVVDPKAAGPGLALCRGLEAVYAGSRKRTLAALREAATRLGLLEVVGG